MRSSTCWRILPIAFSRTDPYPRYIHWSRQYFHAIINLIFPVCRIKTFKLGFEPSQCLKVYFVILSISKWIQNCASHSFQMAPKTKSIQDPNLYLVVRPRGPRPNVSIVGAKWYLILTLPPKASLS